MGTLTNLAGRAISYAMADKCPYKNQCALGSMCHNVEQEVIDCGMYQGFKESEANYERLARESKAEQDALERRNREIDRQSELERKEDRKRQIKEKAQELLDQYKDAAMPYLVRANDILDGKEFELEPDEASFYGNLFYAKKLFLEDMDRVPLIKSANTYLDFCKKYKITPEEDVSDSFAKSMLENAYANTLLQLIEQGKKNYPENEYIKEIIEETKKTLLQYLEKRKQEKAEKEAQIAAEAAKKEADRKAKEAEKKKAENINKLLEARKREESNIIDAEVTRIKRRVWLIFGVSALALTIAAWWLIFIFIIVAVVMLSNLEYWIEPGVKRKLLKEGKIKSESQWVEEEIRIKEEIESKN